MQKSGGTSSAFYRNLSNSYLLASMRASPREAIAV
jgi:hypothetical protein